MTFSKRKPKRFASDEEADDLLADILDSTEDVAREETERIERSIRESREESEREEAEAKRKRIAARQAKLDEELERQAMLAEKREEKLRALSRDDEDGEGEEATEVTNSVADDSVELIAAEVRRELEAELREIRSTPMPEPAPAPRPRSGAPAFALAAVVALAAILGAVAFETTYEPDRNTYAKAVFAPADRDAIALEMGSVPLPTEPEAEAKPPSETRRTPERTNRPIRRPTPPPNDTHKPTKIDEKPEQNDANRAFERFSEALGDSEDPFTIDIE